MNDKYTAEQVRDVHWNMAKEYKTIPVLAEPHQAMGDAIDALLRERESAGAVVTEEMTRKSLRAMADHVAPEGLYTEGELKKYDKGMRADLEAVAPMLSPPQLRTKIDLSTERCLAFRAGALWSLCNRKHVDEPVELYVARPSNNYADSPWEWDRDASQARLASARVPDGLLQLIRDVRHWICNDAPSGLGKRPLLRRLDAMDATLAATPKPEKE